MVTIINNEPLSSILEAEAWKEISECYSLSMDILDNFADKLDWDRISANIFVLWTLEGINRFSDRINWDRFSTNAPDHVINEVTLQKFSKRWNWESISRQDCFFKNWDLLEKFADKVDWSVIIKHREIENPLEFFARFQQYIPMEELQDSTLWMPLVEARAKRIIQEVLGI